MVARRRSCGPGLKCPAETPATGATKMATRGWPLEARLHARRRNLRIARLSGRILEPFERHSQDAPGRVSVARDAGGRGDGEGAKGRANRVSFLPFTLYPLPL